MITKSELISTVIRMVEDQFPGSIVVWSREGYPEQKPESAKIQVFEAYGISEDKYIDFMSFMRVIKRTIARPNGFEIMVHDLTMEETRKYRLDRYQEELDRRSFHQCVPVGTVIIQQYNKFDAEELHWNVSTERILASPASSKLTVAA